MAGRKSPRFEMHSDYRNWYETIPSGQMAKLTVYFDPNYHKEEGLGPQQRAILIFSNSLTGSPKIVRLSAIVIDSRIER